MRCGNHGTPNSVARAGAGAVSARTNKAGDAMLIVMGVSRRPGEGLSFGDTAAAVLEHAPGSVLFVAT
jgi:nucleotide-binding universal stress UspA family protein